MGGNLVDQYLRQARWRHWDEALAVLPLQRGDRVLDLGCGVGDVTARLHARGADVTGIDSNEELLAAARALHPHVRFENADVRDVLPERFGLVDGLWASFVTAYFPDLRPVLARWASGLRPGGWLAMVEIDDLLGHRPRPPWLGAKLEAFYEEARQAGRYDFQGGRALASAAHAVGLSVVHEGVLTDDELAFAGPAPGDVLAAWRERLSRMGGLRRFMGTQLDDFETSFLASLAAESHEPRARVVLVVARRAPVTEAR